MSVKICRLPPRPRAWVLNSVAKFVYCAQTLESRLDEAGTNADWLNAEEIFAFTD